MKPRVLILFPEPWLAYSPSTLNLVSFLRQDFDVKVIAFDTGVFPRHGIDGEDFIYFRVPKPAAWVASRLRTRQWAKVAALWWHARKVPADIVIGVDSAGLWVAQHLKPSADFLSLEVRANDPIFKRIDHTRIGSVLIQTPERYSYLFGSRKIRTFLYQNAPFFKRLPDPGDPNKIVYLGVVNRSHRIEDCVEAISSLPDVSFTVRGLWRAPPTPDFQSLIDEGRLVLDDRYVAQENIVGSLASFGIGLCLFDLNQKQRTNFNLTHNPSGKLFSYFAAGLPVIASNLPGMRPVAEFRAGVLLDRCDPASIRQAITEVQSRYDEFRAGSLRAGEKYDAGDALTPYRETLKRELKTNGRARYGLEEDR